MVSKDHFKNDVFEKKVELEHIFGICSRTVLNKILQT